MKENKIESRHIEKKKIYIQNANFFLYNKLSYFWWTHIFYWKILVFFCSLS